jgi:hypothetical protein
MRHLLLLIIIHFILNDNGISIKNTIDFDESGNQFNLKSFNICNETIFALDNRQKVLFMYDKDGSFIKSHLADGRGPGEFENIPNRVFCLSSGDILLVETNRFHYFNSKLELIETKLFDPVAHLNQWQLAEVLAEFDSTYLISFRSTSELSNNQYALINKDDLSVKRSFGFSRITSNRILGRASSTYSNGKILTSLALTGEIIIYDIASSSYKSFNVQNHITTKELEKIAPTRIRPDDLDSIRFLEDGIIFTNVSFYKEYILIIQSKYVDTPGSQIDIYSLEGILLSSMTLPENITRFSVINDQIYGINEFEPVVYKLNMDIDNF